MLNVNLNLSNEAKIGLLLPQQFGSEAMERWTHFLEEMAVRNCDYIQEMQAMGVRDAIPDLLGDNGRRAAKAISMAASVARAKLFKFGKAKYLLPLLSEGRMRVQPASTFASSVHNVAVGDVETSRTFKVAITGQEILAQSTENGLPSEFIENSTMEITVTSFSDYWMTCFGRSLQPRMAVDFEADAMLAVFNVEELRRRLRNAFRRATDYSKMGHGPVHYFDPYLPNCNMQNVPLIKPFKFYYQHEYRFYWLPTEPKETLQYLEIEMGDLRDICELVTW